VVSNDSALLFYRYTVSYSLLPLCSMPVYAVSPQIVTTSMVWVEVWGIVSNPIAVLGHVDLWKTGSRAVHSVCRVNPRSGARSDTTGEHKNHEYQEKNCCDLFHSTILPYF